MIRKLVCLLAALTIIVQSIDQTCFSSQDCPSQSQCNLSNNYCICNPGFIGNCNVAAQQVSANSISSTLTASQTNYYYTTPTQLQKYIEFLYTICPTSSNQVELTFTFWGQAGTNTQYNANNALVPPVTGDMQNSCLYLTTPYIIFGPQPNGQSQMLILGITDNSDIPTTFTISVSQRIVFVFLIYYYILIGLGIFVAVFLIVGGTIFLVRRRRLRAMGVLGGNQGNPADVPQTNDISYFQVEMPPFKGQLLGSQKSTCPICLMQIQKKQIIRKTPCSHAFHLNCIDSWCLKNLNCPVCRCELSLQKIRQKKAETIKASEYHEIIDQNVEDKPSVYKVEDRPGQQPKPLVEQKYEIRESML